MHTRAYFHAAHTSRRRATDGETRPHWHISHIGAVETGRTRDLLKLSVRKRRAQQPQPWRTVYHPGETVEDGGNKDAGAAVMAPYRIHQVLQSVRDTLLVALPHRRHLPREMQGGLALCQGPGHGRRSCGRALGSTPAAGVKASGARAPLSHPIAHVHVNARPLSHKIAHVHAPMSRAFATACNT